MRIATKTFFILLLAFAIIPGIYAVTLDIGTNLTNGTTSVYVDTIPIVVSIAEVTNNSITLTNVSWTNGELDVSFTGVINWTSGTILTSQFLRFSSADLTTKTVASSLPGLTASYTFNVESCESIGNIYHKRGSSVIQTLQKGGYTCSNNRATVSLTSLTNGDTIVIDYSCSATTQAAYDLIMIFFALALVGIVVFSFYNNGEISFDSLTLGKIVTVFVVLIVGIIMWQVSGQNLGGSCPIN